VANKWIRIETRGFKEFKAAMNDAPQRIKAVGRQWTKEVAADEVKYIRKEAPKKTGRFARTIEPYARDWVVGIRILPYPKLGYKLYRWIVGGTKPHIIRARRAQALHFYWTKRRKWVFFKWVRHPGTKSNPFVERGASKFQPRVKYWVNELGKRITKALSK